jgi:hypothetical protein
MENKMKNSIFIFLFVICSLIIQFLTGCSTSYIVTKNGEGNDKMSYKEFNREIKGEDVTLEFTKGPESEGSNIRVDTNYAKFYDFELQETRSVQTGLLKTVVRRNGMGLEGFGIGLLSGAALFYLAGSLGIRGDGKLDWHATMPIFGGLVGGLIGAIIGATIGHKYEYKFVRK